MKHTIKTILLSLTLVLADASHAWAISESDIIINVQPNKDAGTVTVTNISESTVTISAVPASGSGYVIDASHILVERMVNPSSRRRAPGLPSGLEVTDNHDNTYSFTIPSGYDGAYVTATFFKQAAAGFTAITSLSEIADDLTGSYQLTADVDASSLSSSLGAFTGTLDGGFHKIYNLSVPLFSSTSGSAVIRNVTFEDVNITSGDSNGDAGAVTAKAEGSTRIYNCGILPTTTERDNDGNITGFSGSSVGGTRYVGGLVGMLSGNARVINCYSYANITGGSTVAGIVGFHNANSHITQDDVATKPMIVNCMFYGDITGGTNKFPVYGGRIGNNDMIKTDYESAKGVNPYNYFRANALFDNAYTNINNYKRSWPAEEKYLTRFEYYRSILNSNRHLCTYWVTGKTGTEQTAADTALIAKWVLDPSIAPYPILKKWGRYPSVINQDPEQVWNPQSKQWVSRRVANDYEGKYLGELSVTINAGSGHAGSGVSSKERKFIIMDMDTLNNDYCYGKIQLPYYNEVFGDPTTQIPEPSAEDYSAKWDNRYSGNYKSQVVTGWKITSVDKTGTNSFVVNWESGYNFADRNCTEKDLFSKSGRVFAQGGYYYVPEGVTAITIEAYWGDAFYLRNEGNYIDRVNICKGKGNAGNGDAFTPAGTLPTTFQGKTVYDNIQTAIGALKGIGNGKTVYDQAIVLVGNVQRQNESTVYGKTGNNAHPFTMMSADLDLDCEPDFCLQLQFRKETDRPGIQPIRFDFLPIPELGLAIRPDNKAYSIGIMIPLGHFEITETAFMHTTQFEYDGNVTKVEAPLILNGGHFEQIVVRAGPKNRTSYIQMGGHFWMKRFTPGWHVTPQKPNQYDGVRHCAVNVLGGEYPEFYLSGIYNIDNYDYSSSTNNDKYKANVDNPHCYVNGGRFNIMAGAGYETVDGDVTFKIDHAVIDEFYGGGINGSKPVRGSIDVTIDHSKVGKYCGGPKVGSMQTGKTVTTSATGTVFGEYFGGGNGGTSYYRQTKDDKTPSMPSNDENGWGNRGGNNGNYGFPEFNPLNTIEGVSVAYDIGTDKKGYHAEYEFELFNSSNGTDANVVQRSYYRWAQFGTTVTGTVSNTLTDCTVNSNFYGGGNLGNVNGDVTSQLKGETHIKGSAYAGGFSASIPHFPIHDKANAVFPSRDFSGVITDGHIPYIKDGGEIRYYTWCYKNPTTGAVSPAGVVIPEDVSTTKVGKSTFQYGGKWYCYTTVSLENLGTVSGNASIEIDDDTIIDGSVYGGGDESAVDEDSTVTLKGNTQVGGNVFGGGNRGLVSGNATVNIQN